MKSDLKWHLYELLPESTRIDRLVVDVDKDPHGAFFFGLTLLGRVETSPLFLPSPLGLGDHGPLGDYPPRDDRRRDGFPASVRFQRLLVPVVPCRPCKEPERIEDLP